MKKQYFANYFLAAFAGLWLAACSAGTAQNQRLDSTSLDTSKPIPVDKNLIETEADVEINNDFPAEKITKDFLMGKFDPAKDTAYYTLVPSPYATQKIYVLKATLAAFKKMHAAAKKDGISFTIVSGVRNFNTQKSIWEAKWNRERPVDGKILPPLSELKGKARAEKILLWNSMPGTSRHHWGTDIDLNSVSPAYFKSGKGLKEYEWLKANAATYGFCQTYSTMVKENPQNEERTTGYQEEKWHWSYAPLGKIFTETYGRTVKNEDIKGFEGCASAIEIDVVKNYVLGINPNCK